MESQVAAGDDEWLSTTQTPGVKRTTTMTQAPKITINPMPKTSESLKGTMVDGLHEQLDASTQNIATAGEDDNKMALQLQQLAQASGLAKNKKLFPQKLWDLIHDDNYNFCLRWSDDGQLVYLNRDEFEDSYLKTSQNQFHTQKAISFVRQMNMYGFRKVDDCYYENDNFKRNCNHLLKNMIRKHPAKTHHQSQHLMHNNNHLVSTRDTNTFQSLQPSSPLALASPSKQQLVATTVVDSLASCNSFANINSSNDFNNCDDILLSSAQAANFQSLYNGRQKELIQILLAQQHIQQQQLVASNLASCNSFANINSSLITNDFNNCDNMLLKPAQTANFQSLYNDRQKELIQVLLTQQHIQQQQLQQSISQKARDSGKSRPLKRSVDSLLLDSNNNSCETRDIGQNQCSKRIRILDGTTGGDDSNFRRVINKYAKNLVTQVALAMGAKVDTLVIAQASRITEQFVETLFDTAQVIARHSNCSKLADNGFDDYVHVKQEKKDLKHNNKETERSNINLSDLTSALKLLPSKFLNLLQ